MESDYHLIEIQDSSRQGVKIYRVKEKDSSSQNQTGFLSLHLSTLNISNEDFTKLRKLKILNVLQPRNYYETRNEKILIYPDIQEYKLQHYSQVQDVNRILLQLALTYNEFEKRETFWPLNSINQLYYLKGILYISLIEYDFVNPQTQQSPFQIFKKFTLLNFANLIPDINIHLQQTKFQPIISYLLEKNGNLHKINYLNPPYENVLLYLLNQNEKIKLQPIYEQGNSVVKGFTTPECLKIVYSKLCDQIVYKSSRFQQEEFKDQILSNIQREIEVMEKCYDSESVVACFAYIRIFEYSFLLQKRFVGTLADFLRMWTVQNDRTEHQTIKDVLLITNRFALALKSLKKLNILHRDLKPENLFLDHNELNQSFIYIADFDRSKSLDGQMEQIMTTQNVENTPKYDPPEKTQSFKYDNYQFGLIILTIANKGKYIGNELQGSRYFSDIEHESYYSKEAIAKALSHTKYDPIFIDVLAKCLKRNPDERPDIEEIYQQINPLYLQTRIRHSLNPQPCINDSSTQNQTNFNPTSYNLGNFDQGNFNQTNFNQTNQNQTNFNPTNFNQGNCNQTNFNQTNFNQANFNQTNFNQTNQNQTNQNQTNQNQTNFNQANFNQTNFNQTNFNPTNFNQGNFNQITYNPTIFQQQQNQKIKQLPIQSPIIIQPNEINQNNGNLQNSYPSPQYNQPQQQQYAQHQQNQCNQQDSQQKQHSYQQQQYQSSQQQHSSYNQQEQSPTQQQFSLYANSQQDQSPTQQQNLQQQQYQSPQPYQQQFQQALYQDQQSPQLQIYKQQQQQPQQFIQQSPTQPQQNKIRILSQQDNQTPDQSTFQNYQNIQNNNYYPNQEFVDDKQTQIQQQYQPRKSFNKITILQQSGPLTPGQNHYPE